jgi:hypothetical protein
VSRVKANVTFVPLHPLQLWHKEIGGPRILSMAVHGLRPSQVRRAHAWEDHRCLKGNWAAARVGGGGNVDGNVRYS